MKIEALIPCYNSARCIERAVASVLAQTRCADRLTLLDDASTDATPDVLTRLSALRPGMRVLRSERNLGILGARQRLVEQSEGDILCFLDHDDAWPAGHLARVAEAMSRDAVVACIAPAVNLDERGRELSRSRPGPGPLRAANQPEGVRTLFMRYPVPTWSCVAIRRTAALRISELSGFPSGEEFALLALALEHGDVEFLSGPFVERHLGGSNAILDPKRQYEADLALFRWFAGRYPWLSGDLPSKLTAIYANSVYRYTVAGDLRGAREMRAALLRGVLHPKLLAGIGALTLGTRLLRWLRPAA
jgi:glycosyltransferase involved in cell wall biosynthesis